MSYPYGSSYGFGYERGNHAINTNGPYVTGEPADIAITGHGSNFYFTICALMGAATLAFLALAHRRPRTHRLFHYITAAITLVAFVAYFCMGANLGWTRVNVEHHRSGARVRGQTREIFYVRYIDWFITTTLLLLDLLLTAALPWPTIFWVILVDWVMIVTGLIGALVASRYKWGFFTIGCVALFYIIYVLAVEARRHASARGVEVGRAYRSLGAWTAFLWLLYPIAWGVSEGGNVIAPDSEAVFYGILDFLAKPVFGALLIWSHRNIDPAVLGLHTRDYDDDPAVRRGHVTNEMTTGTTHHPITSGNTTTTTTTYPTTGVVLPSATHGAVV